MEMFYDDNPLLPPVSFRAYYDELQELLNDLYFNALRFDLEPLLDALDRVDLGWHVQPSFTLVEIMHELAGGAHHSPEYREFLQWAVEEMLALTNSV